LQFLAFYTPIENVAGLGTSHSQTDPVQPGFYALRSALVLAAADPIKAWIAVVLRQFYLQPIDRYVVSRFRSELESLINQTT